ncbi:AAA family ATPase [Lentzea sp. PSKA42]|uniref:AAA family ATPase n=1 Tax=Lentzea indica TaxID=2604800 RepID=A0ABX1FM38_9PSEU|nr:P-loop NTPase fold protein [Lentzea indica]NKE60025.1 AAA family ATPase [Lentzea indica]
MARHLGMSAPRPFYRVSVSDPPTGFRRQWAALMSALNDQHLMPVDNNTARVAWGSPLEMSLRVVRDTVAYVAMTNTQYGHVPASRNNPERLSINHLEYREAVRLGRPTLVFGQGKSIRDIESDADNRAKLIAFREEAERTADGVRNVYLTFEDSTDFAEMAARAVAELRILLDAEPDLPESIPEHPDDTDADGVEVGWSTDSATSTDLLRRDSLARVLNSRLRDAKEGHPHTSLLVHLDGTWGSGKSSVLLLLAKELEEQPPFLVVWFDAWQQSRVSPPWWALLTTLRQHVLADRGRFSRAWLRFREMWARMRVSGAPYTVALILLLILSAGVGYATWWLANKFTPTTSDLIKLFTPAIAMVSFLWAGSRVAARAFLWASAGGARLFEQSNSNPMTRIALHFDWLLKRSKKPVVFFVDDLDRCREDYVVEFLDSVHTLVRDAPRSHYRAVAKRSAPAAYFVVAADGAWIRQSYEHAYSTFEVAEGPLGYLFMDKLFQLNVPMPALGGSTQKEFMGSLLGLTAGPSPQVASASAAIKHAGNDEAAIIETLEGLSPAAREAVAGEAALALASSETRKHTEHTLRKFSPMLHGNPRSIKLFLNTYSMLRSVRTLEGSTLPPDTLALWVLIRVRWPSIADVLARNPDAVEGIKDDLWCADHFPEELRAFAKSKDLRRVVLHDEGGPLTAALVRQCCGLAEG